MTLVTNKLAFDFKNIKESLLGREFGYVFVMCLNAFWKQLFRQPVKGEEKVETIS